MLLQLSHFFLLFFPLHPAPSSLSLMSMSMGCTYKFFGFSISYTILNHTNPRLFSTYHLCFLFPVPFPLFSPLPIPTDNLPCDLHFCYSVPVRVVCLLCFCFCSCFFFLVQLLIVVILLFIFLIFLLDKSL